MFICHLRISDDRHSKGRDNFLIQQKTREMGQVFFVVTQIHPSWPEINLHPNSIVFIQVQRGLESQRTPLIIDSVCFLNITQSDSTRVQIKTNSKINFRGRIWKWRLTREWKEINSRARCREYPRRQIHGVSLVHPRQLERNRSFLWVKWRISLDVEMNGRRFDVGVSDPFLFVC